MILSSFRNSILMEKLNDSVDKFLKHSVWKFSIYETKVDVFFPII